MLSNPDRTARIASRAHRNRNSCGIESAVFGKERKKLVKVRQSLRPSLVCIQQGRCAPRRESTGGTCGAQADTSRTSPPRISDCFFMACSFAAPNRHCRSGRSLRRDPSESLVPGPWLRGRARPDYISPGPGGGKYIRRRIRHYRIMMKVTLTFCNIAVRLIRSGSWEMLHEKPCRRYHQVGCQTRPAVPALNLVRQRVPESRASGLDPLM